MRDVHHHAEAIHFAHDVFAKIGEAIVNSFVSGRIGPFVVSAVSEGHVANAKAGKLTKHGKIAVDHVAAFYTHERSDLTFLFRFANFGGGGGQYDVAWMLTHLFAYRIDLLESAAHRFGAGDFARDPNRKENRVEAAFFHTRDINAAGIGALAEIELAIQKALRGVVVGVHDDGRKMQLAGFLRNGDSGEG